MSSTRLDNLLDEFDVLLTRITTEVLDVAVDDSMSNQDPHPVVPLKGRPRRGKRPAVSVGGVS